MFTRVLDCPIFSPSIASSNFGIRVNHCMLPVVERLHGETLTVLFADRDTHNRSFIRRVKINLLTMSLCSDQELETVFEPGELGCFDDNGVSPSCITTQADGSSYLYYIGWKPRSTVRFSLIGGIAKLQPDTTYARLSRAPIFKLTNDEPFHLLTAPWVIYDSTLSNYKMWYVSGTGWLSPDKPTYNIKYAESQNGRNWNQNIAVCIDNSPTSTSLARPSVIFHKGAYHMWYSSKNYDSQYSIFYATSLDGHTWPTPSQTIQPVLRPSVSPLWDSEMVEYTYPFIFNEQIWALYNGNNYGQTGFGILKWNG